MSSELGGLFLDIWQTQFLNVKEIVARDPVAARAYWREQWAPLSLVSWGLRTLVVEAVTRAAHGPARPWPMVLVAFYSLCCVRMCDDPEVERAARARREPWELDISALWVPVGSPFHRYGMVKEALPVLAWGPLPFCLVHYLRYRPMRFPCRMVKWVCFWAMADTTLMGGEASVRWDAFVYWLLDHMPVSTSRKRERELAMRRRLVAYLSWDAMPDNVLVQEEGDANDVSYAPEQPPRAYTVASFRRFCERYHGCARSWGRSWADAVPCDTAFQWPDPTLYPWAEGLDRPSET